MTAVTFLPITVALLPLGNPSNTTTMVINVLLAVGVLKAGHMSRAPAGHGIMPGMT